MKISLEGTGLKITILRIYMINRSKDLSMNVYPLQTVQFHPEANPGPAESEYIFDEFIETVKANNGRVIAYA